MKIKKPAILSVCACMPIFVHLLYPSPQTNKILKLQAYVTRKFSKFILDTVHRKKNTFGMHFLLNQLI